MPPQPTPPPKKKHTPFNLFRPVKTPISGVNYESQNFENIHFR